MNKKAEIIKKPAKKLLKNVTIKTLKTLSFQFWKKGYHKIQTKTNISITLLGLDNKQV